MGEGNAFIRGAFLLALAGFISKILGSVYTIFLQNLIGDRGLGLYQMAYPVYSTLLLLSTAGIPLAVSKFVAERAALGDQHGARRVFHVSWLLLFLIGIVFFLLLFLGADHFARLFGDPASAYAIRAIAPALLLVPVTSAIRGYFQGWQEMGPTAVSQVIEQFVRVGTILVAAVILLPYGEAYAAAGAAFGAVTGAVASFLLLIAYMWKRRFLFRLDGPLVMPRANLTAKAEEKQEQGKGTSFWFIAKQLCWYALPISLGAMIVPLMNNIDVFTVVNLLKEQGYSQEQATEMFGLLTGRAFKLMLLPSTFATAIGAAVLPAISAAMALQNQRLVYRRMDLAIRLTMLISLPAAVGLALLAGPIDIALFKDEAGAGAIAMISLATLFSAMLVTTTAILQGIGIVYLPVLHLLIGGALKIACNVWLVPRWGIEGAALSTVLAYGVAMGLNMWKVYRSTGVILHVRQLIWRPLLATFVMAVVAYGVMGKSFSFFLPMFSARLACAAAVCVTVIVAGWVYGFALLLTGSLTRRDLYAIPRVGPAAVRVFQKIRLL